MANQTVHQPRSEHQIVDYFSGMFCLAGIEAALYQRTKTSEGAQIDLGMFVSPCDTYSTFDSPIITICGNDETFRRLCGALGVPDIANTSSFRTGADRITNEAALKTAMEEILRCRTARDWELILGEAGVPCAVVGTVTEAVNNPQLKSRNMIVSAGLCK
jgi:CoA:oxalate CoA-transferase